MKRNKFSLSHFRLMSCTMGQLVPIGWYDVIPGDTVQQSTALFVRAAPLVVPPMHPVHVRVHHFFVPNRILWQGTNPSGSSATGGWENFITGGADGLDATAHPYIHLAQSNSANTLSDYLGLPVPGGAIGAGWPWGGSINVNALPYRAYQLIWNEFFRDEDLQTLAAISTADGADSTTSTAVQNVCWQKDYYTTARPWEAKGPSVGVFPSGAAVTLQMITGGTATTHATYPGVPTQATNTQSAAAVAYDSNTDLPVAGTSWSANLGNVSGSSSGGLSYNDINSLRRQFALQRFQEARAKYGSRYVEYLRYLGVRSSDARLQRPEYLGGGTSTIQFSEVLQTGVTTSGSQSGVGTMFGHGITGQRTNRFRRFFEEHGIVMSLMSCRPITVYTNPIMRKWLRGMTAAGGATAPAGLLGTREDYFVRELQNIGQQQINQVEVEAVGTGASPANTLGYQDRYDEYRRHESQVTGQFRTTLNTWHFARNFATAPTLNSTFVSSAPSVLPFADQAHDNLYVMCNHSIQARRMLSRVGVGFVR